MWLYYSDVSYILSLLYKHTNAIATVAVAAAAALALAFVSMGIQLDTRTENGRQVSLMRHIFASKRRTCLRFYCEWEYAAAYISFAINCLKCAHVVYTFVVFYSVSSSSTWRRITCDFGKVKWLISSWKGDIKCMGLTALRSYNSKSFAWFGMRMVDVISWRGFYRRLHLNTMMRSNYLNQILHICTLWNEFNFMFRKWSFVAIKSSKFCL